MEAVETRTKQGRTSISEKKLQAALCMMLNSKPSHNIFKTYMETVTEIRFLKWLRQSKTPINVTREKCLSDETKLHA